MGSRAPEIPGGWVSGQNEKAAFASVGSGDEVQSCPFTPHSFIPQALIGHFYGPNALLGSAQRMSLASGKFLSLLALSFPVPRSDPVHHTQSRLPGAHCCAAAVCAPFCLHTDSVPTAGRSPHPVQTGFPAADWQEGLSESASLGSGTWDGEQSSCGVREGRGVGTPQVLPSRTATSGMRSGWAISSVLPDKLARQPEHSP